MDSPVPQIDANTYATWRDQGKVMILVDVREPHERNISVLPDQFHIPMKQVSRRFMEIPMDQPVVVYCRSGSRSAQVVEFLLAAGFDEVYNLAGGINGYAEEFDPTMEIY